MTLSISWFRSERYCSTCLITFIMSSMLTYKRCFDTKRAPSTRYKDDDSKSKFCQHMNQRSMSCIASMKARTAQHAASCSSTPFEYATASPAARPLCPLASLVRTSWTSSGFSRWSVFDALPSRSCKYVIGRASCERQEKQSRSFASTPICKRWPRPAEGRCL